MRYCVKCLQPDTRPGIEFSEDGVCSACVYHFEVKPKIDWSVRRRELKEITAWAKANKKGPYDCIIGVSGGKDSHFQALYAKEQLGLRALLVNYFPDDMTDEGRRNLDNLCNQGFDLMSIRPNPKVMAACCKKAFYELLHPVKPTEYPLHVVTCQTAVKFGIPLFIHGENIALTLGVTGARQADGDALGCRHNVTVAGGNAGDWIQDGVTLEDLFWYQYPDEAELRKNVRGVHLDYYEPEFSRQHNMKFAISRGLVGSHCRRPCTHRFVDSIHQHRLEHADPQPNAQVVQIRVRLCHRRGLLRHPCRTPNPGGVDPAGRKVRRQVRRPLHR